MEKRMKKGLYVILAILIVIIFLMAIIRNQQAENNQLLSEKTEIPWSTNIDSALGLAREQNLVLMIDFMAVWCPPCQAMENSTFNQPEIIEKAKAFIPVRIDVDQQRAVAERYNANAAKYGGIGIPNLLFLTTDEKRIRHLIGFQSAQQLLAVMDSVLTAT
jgi:thiol:disulfide interchange protein DsbD